jgi:hypothetical protein
MLLAMAFPNRTGTALPMCLAILADEKFLDVSINL